jgi:hypothetical protein
MKIKNVFLYKKKNNISNLIFKKKIVKKLYLNKKEFFYTLKILKVLLLLNFYDEKIPLYSFFKNYNFLKNIWHLFIITYYYINNNIKKKITYFFNSIIKTNLIKNLFSFKNRYLKKLNFLFFFKFKLNKILKVTNLNLLLKFLNWRRKYLKINFFIEPSKLNKEISLFSLKPFLSNYKKIIFISLIKYLIKFFKFEIEKSFVLFWKRLYIYKLKFLLLKIEYIIKKYFDFLLKQYKLFYSIVNFSYQKKRKNRVFFFFSLLNKIIGKEYLDFFNFYKLFEYYKYVKDCLFNCKYIKKVNFFLFFFKYKKIKNNYISIFYKKLKLLKVIIKIKILIIIKNLIFLFFLQFFMYWLNNYNFLNKDMELKKPKENNLNVESIKSGLNIMKKLKWNRLPFFRLNYFFYNNIMIKKSSEIGKIKKNLIK